MPRPLTPPSEVIPGGGCRAYRATADLQTNSGGIILKVPDRSSAPSALLENFASAPSAQPIDAHQPARICRRCPASCSAAGSGSQPPAGSAAAWASGEPSFPIWQSYLHFWKRLSSFSSYFAFYIGIYRRASGSGLPCEYALQTYFLPCEFRSSNPSFLRTFFSKN